MVLFLTFLLLCLIGHRAPSHQLSRAKETTKLEMPVSFSLCPCLYGFPFPLSMNADYDNVGGKINCPRCGPEKFELTRKARSSTSLLSSGAITASTNPRAAAYFASSSLS